MKRLLYVLCGIIFPFVAGIIVSIMPLVIGMSWLKLLVITLVVIAALWLQRVLRVLAGITFSLSQKLILYTIVICWWLISIMTTGSNIAAIATLGNEKRAIIQLIRNCWITSRIHNIKNPTFFDLLDKKLMANIGARRSFYTIIDPKTNNKITSEYSSQSSCFDIAIHPIPLAFLGPKIRATLPDITDTSAAVFQNMTESIVLKDKKLNTRPWNRIKPDAQNILRTCSSTLGFACNQSLNSKGIAW